MIQRIFVDFILIFLVYWKPCNSALPKWVHRVESCPDVNNFSQWIDASKRLNCYHDLTSIDAREQAKVYHCLPTCYLNETVEFCAMNVPIAPGNCPIYNYKYGENIAPSYYNCSRFASGCPQKMFFSKNVYKYPECLKINRVDECFEAEATCKKCTTTSSIETTTMNKPKGLLSITSSTTKPSDSINIIEMAQGEDSSKIVHYVLIGFSILLVFCALIGIRWFFLHRRKLSLYKFMFSKRPPRISEKDLNDLMESQRKQTETLKKEHNRTLGHENEDEREKLLNEMCKGSKLCQYNVLFSQLNKAMSKQELKRIKRLLKDRIENASDDLDAIKDPMDLLDYINAKYLAYYNIAFLQGLFLTCKAPMLYDICVDYGKKRKQEVTFFEKRILEKDHTEVKYIINCPDMTSYSEGQLEKLRNLLATLVGAQFEDVIVCGLKDGCVIVTFMIRNCLISKLRALYTSDKQSMICQWMFKLSLKYQVVKVMIQHEAVYMSNLLSTVGELKAEAQLCRNIPPSLNTTSGKQSEICKVVVPKELGSFEDQIKCQQSCIKDMNRRTQVSRELRVSLESSLGCLTDDTLLFMKKALLDIVDEKHVKKMNTTKILTEIWDMLRLEHNMEFLEWVFDTYGEKLLLKKYQRFSSENQVKLECFNTDFSQGRGSQSLEFHIMVFELELYNGEIQDLRKWLADISNAHPGEILMRALESKPIVITYLMRKNHANAILDFIRTDEGQIAASRNRVAKVIENGNVITIAKAVNGSNFVQVRLRCKNNRPGKLDKRIQNAASRIVKGMGIKTEGKQVYLRAVPENDNDEELSDAKVFMQTNKSQLLENLEPTTLSANHEIISLFGKDAMAKMENIDSRKEKASYFLGLCNKLPKGELEKVVLHLKEIISSSKTIPVKAKSDPIRNWIQENRNIILDEIDSDFIETTMNNMDDVSDDVKALWSNRSKGRKERAQLFLDYVLQRDDYVLALHKTLEENGIELAKNELIF